MPSTVALICKQQPLIRVAIANKQRPILFDADLKMRRGLVDDIYYGRVVHSHPSYYWVDIGLERPGLLALEKHFPPLNEGDYVVVQIRREAFQDAGEPGGYKGVQLTRNLTYISPVGVLRPYSSTPYQARENQLEDNEAFQKKLNACHQQTLSKAASNKKIQLLTAGPSVWQRLLRDLAPQTPVIINDYELLAEAQRFCQEWRPDLYDLLRYEQAVDLFEAYGVDESWQECLTSSIKHKGTTLVFESTSCVTTIDINGEGHSSYDCNKDAIQVIAQHLQWRRLSGNVLIDFMTPHPSQRSTLLKLLEAALANFKPHWTILGWTRAGFCELQRSRTRISLAQVMDSEVK